MKERILFWGVIAFVVIVGVLPLVVLTAGSFFEEGHFSLRAYQTLLQNRAMLIALQNSFMLGVTVAFLTTLIGTVLALLLVKSDMPSGAFLFAPFAVPLLIPSYIFAFSWAGIFGKAFYGFWGVVFILFWVYLPVVVFVVSLYLRRIDPSIEEAALLVTDVKGVLWGVTLPSIREALLFAFILVFILAFGEFGVANFLRYPVFATQSFVYFSAFYDFKAATAAAFPVVLVLFVVLWMERYVLEVTHYLRESGKKPLRFALGQYRNVALFFVVFLLLLGVVTPLFKLILQVKEMHYLLLALEQGWQPMFRTVGIGMLSATLLMFFGFLAAYAVVYKVVRAWRLFDGVVLFLFALPSVVLGVGLILLWNRSYTNFIYTTVMILLFAYLGKYLALSMKTLQARLEKLPPSLHEAAMLCGAKWYQVYRYIIIPLSREALLVAWVIGFVVTVRETTMTMLLHPPGMDTLAVYILTQMANGKEEMIASLSLWMVGISLLFPLILLMWQKRGGEKR